MDKNWNAIRKFANEKDGFIRTGDIEDLEICRAAIKKYIDAGKLEKVRKGLYILADDLPDEFSLIQAQSSKAVFSFGTALYIWGLSDRIPHIFDITVPQGTNISRLKRDSQNILVHYVQTGIYGLGITKTKSPQGGEIKLYDRERCICDLIKNKDKVDMQLFTQAIKEYFRNKPDKRKLLKYSKQMNIEEKVRTYTEVL